MREIKFKALKKDKSDTKFVYGQLMYNEDGNPVIISIDGHNNKINFNTCIKGTECQSTERQDINGVDIYEGDIVRCDWSKKNQYNPVVTYYKGIEMTLANDKVQLQEVFYSKHGAGFFVAVDKEFSEKKYRDEQLLTRHMAKTFIEVVGNIHNNE